MSNDPSGSFDFGTAFEPERPPSALPPSPLPPPTPSAYGDVVRVAPRTGGRPAAAARSRRRGQGLAWTALALAVGSAVAIGAGIFLALDSINVTLDRPFREARDWMTLVTLGLCAGVLALAGAIVSEVRSRPRTVATLALVGALTLPLIALILGVNFGLDALGEHVSDGFDEIRDGTLVAVSESVRDGHFDLKAFVQVLLALLG